MATAGRLLGGKESSVTHRVLTVWPPSGSTRSTWELARNQMLRPHPKPTESETLRWGPAINSVLQVTLLCLGGYEQLSADTKLPKFHILLLPFMTCYLKISGSQSSHLYDGDDNGTSALKALV